MAHVNPMPAFRALALRPAVSRRAGIALNGARANAKRAYADDAKSTNDPSKLPKAGGKDAVGPNMQQQEHVSEEAAKTAKIMGQQGPDIEGQGTPVQDILKEEPEQRENAPKVLKDTTSSTTGKRSFSTLARRMTPDLVSSGSSMQSFDPSMLPPQEQRTLYASPPSVPAVKQPGHKFPLPTLPLSPRATRQHREEPIVTQLTKLMMRDGKLAKAQGFMAHVLNVLRTSPPPTYNTSKPLLPGAPPASHLPLDPIHYLTLAIDSAAPLLRIRAQRGAAGGGVALQIPVPLNVRQRRRTVFQWVLDSAEKKKSRGSGDMMFPQKVAEELISIVEGKSAIWQRRDALHKLGTAARMNMATFMRRRRR